MRRVKCKSALTNRFLIVRVTQIEATFRAASICLRASCFPLDSAKPLAFSFEDLTNFPRASILFFEFPIAPSRHFRTGGSCLDRQATTTHKLHNITR